MTMAKKFLLTIGALVVAGGVAAHSPEKGKHGGQVVEAGDYHVEAVVKGNSLEVFLRDHDDKDVSSNGYKGVAILIVNGKPVQVTLAPRGQSTLVGTAEAPLTAPIRGAIQITTSKNRTVQAKF